MTEEEQRDLAKRLAEGTRLGFEGALRLVRLKPGEAKRLIREREESERKQEELSRAFQRLRLAARELR
jgi:hypothetical protein